MLKMLKQDKLFIAVVLVILIAGVYFFAAYVPIKYTIRKDYTGMEYAPDMSVISDSVSLHIYGYYYDYILETRNADYFWGKFEVSSIPEIMNTDAHFLIHNSYLEPKGNKKNVWMWYPMVDGFHGSIIMEKQFSIIFMELGTSGQDGILIFPAENHEQAAKVYEKLESAIVRKGLFDKEIENTEKDIADRLPLSDGWRLEENENGVYVLSYHDSKVASITDTSEFAYGENSQMIVSNWIGMHASLTEETNILKNAQGDRIDKVLIAIEPSAAEQMAGAAIVQELHYFYVASDNYFMDIVLIDNTYVSELEILLAGI